MSRGGYIGAYRYWARIPLPDALPDPLFVYRGHGAEAASVRQWLDGLPPSVQKVGYFDFDPAGLGIVLDYGMAGVLIPDPLDEALLEGINNKPEAFDAQMAQRPDLSARLPAPLQPVWGWMSAGHRRCAVTQERLLVLEWPLRVVWL